MTLAEYRAEATLRDGTAVLVRAIRPDDRAALREGFQHLSERTIYQRFFLAKHDLTDAELRYLTELDFHDHLGLVVEVPGAQGARLIAVGRAVRIVESEPGSPDRPHGPSPAPHSTG
jgi:hypothetical protein